MIERWRRRARRLRREVYALYLACKDPRVPWYARLLVGGVVAYAFSPLDLIPDAIPVLGYLDDLVLVPLGIALALRLIPPPVLAECRREARWAMDEGQPVNRRAAGAIIAIWLAPAAPVALDRLVT
ncbi:MAG TPA: YkvA family protein [Thermomicrobiales bacterium]|nr:YkvA family protein [Thermomicrobiales bacterium]